MLLCSTCRKHSLVLTSFMTYHRVCNMTGTTSRAETAGPSGAPEFTSCFIGIRVTLYLVLLCCLFFDLRILITHLVSSN
jgi:hypothetical protein